MGVGTPNCCPSRHRASCELIRGIFDWLVEYVLSGWRLGEGGGYSGYSGGGGGGGRCQVGIGTGVRAGVATSRNPLTIG